MSIIRNRRLLAAAVVCTVLVGCQSTPPQPLAESEARAAWESQQQEMASISGWNVKGKMAVRTGRKGGSATLVWQFRQDQQEIELYGPFGGGRVMITADADGAILRDTKGNIIEGASASEVLYRRLGWQVPFEQLEAWCRGIPAEGATDITLDDSGYLQSFQQGNWRVEYDSFQSVEQMKLPRKMRVSALPGSFEIYDDDGTYLGDELSVKIILRRWWDLTSGS